MNCTYSGENNETTIFCLPGKGKILISGAYSSEMAITMGKSDGYLQLTSINIFRTEGRYPLSKSYYLDPYVGGVLGGVIGCCSPSKKIKKKDF